MLKSSTGKLYTLLSACKSNDAKVKKRLLVIEIMEMSEYKALQVYQGAEKVMMQYYAPEKLQEISFGQLQEVRKIIPFLEDCISKLYAVICFGDVRALHGKFTPDFYKYTSIKEIYDFVLKQKETGVNITNLTEDNVWSVFDKETILSLDEKLNVFDSKDIEMLEIQISERLKEDTYCISAAEINEKRHSYRDIYRKKETIRIKMQIVENKIFVKKIIITLVSCVIVTAFALGININGLGLPAALGGFIITVFSGIEVAARRIATLTIYTLLLFAYWIKG